MAGIGNPIKAHGRPSERAKPAPVAALPEKDSLTRLDELFEKSAAADRMKETKRCTRTTENGACNHFKLKADMYCEFHKNPALFAASGYADYTFYYHASLGADVKTRLAALKP